MQDCGIILSSPCVEIPRRPTKGMDATNCLVGGPKIAPLPSTRPAALTCQTLLCIFRSGQISTTTLVTAGAKGKESLTKIRCRYLLSLIELPPTHTRADTEHPQGDPERGPGAAKDILAYLKEPHEKKAVTW